MIPVQTLLNKHKYDIWLTTTFRKRTLLEEAVGEFKYFFKHVNKPEEIFFHKYILAWVFFEQDNWRGGVHIHSVINGIEPSWAGLLEKRCRDFFGQSHVKPYDYSLPETQSAINYLGQKYVSGKLPHYDFYRINSKLRRIYYPL